MKEKDDSFYYSTDLDDVGRLKTLLWVHGRSRAYYKAFGQVLSFDSTYRTNVYGMPFAPFVGVNNHKQSILLGGALLTDETAPSYNWVFKQWLEAMDGIQPTAILTDQDLAMKSAIANVFPTTIHRYCIWHITRKFKEKLKKLQHVFRNCVCNSMTREEFDNKWEQAVKDNKQEKNEWLSGLFREREHWVPAYLHGTFFAGMCSTQRSESMNNFFNGYVDQRSNLTDFIKGYEQAFLARVAAEIEANTKDINCKVGLRTSWPIEYHASTVYTNVVFMEVQDQIMKRSSFFLKLVVDDEISKSYQVISFDNEGFTNTVYLDPTTNGANCTCNYFNFKGWPCCHMLRVFEHLGIRNLPESCVFKRWTKKALEGLKDKHIIEDASSRKSNSTVPRELSLGRVARKYVELAARNETTYLNALDWLAEHINSIEGGDGHDEDMAESLQGLDGIGSSKGLEENSIRSKTTAGIKDPVLHRQKGRPPTRLRIQSPIEKKRVKQGRVCKGCNELGHNIRTCKKRKYLAEEESETEET